MKAYHQLIRGPIITEKTHSQREANNKLTLQVDVKANKIEIRKAIETLFKVKVLSVNTIQMLGKKKRLGRNEGKRPDWKKAIVTLAPGEKIAGYEGL
ncbi:MAG: 50S ribosomal protein L23 [Deltaproteobacteria bacterium]|nr:50S ribosomal protein L23 [Deltaproteobacteria bacterium]